MDVVERVQLIQALESRRDVIADQWYRAIARTSFVPFRFAEVRQRLGTLTGDVLGVLLADPFAPGQAGAIGETLVQLHYVHPEALAKTEEVLAREVTAGLPAAAVAALQPRLAAILGEVAAGFFARARAAILAEQETIHAALLSARAQAEEARHQSEARFRAVFDNAAIGIGVADIEGRVLDSNRAMQAMLGYGADELRGVVVTVEFAHPDDLGSDWELYRELVAGQRDSFQIEKVFNRRNGEPIWCHVTVSLVRNPEGRPEFAIAMMEDITERKRVHETIRQLNVDLERRVLERTAQLTAINEQLTAEIARRAQVEAERLQLLAQEQAARAEAEAARRRLAFLAEASGVLAASLDYRTTLTDLAQVVVPFLADWCAVDLAGEEMSPERVAVAHVDSAKLESVRAAQQHHSPEPGALSGVLQVLRTGRPEFLPAIPEAQVLAAAGGPEATRLLDALRPVSRITVPLVARERVLGAITLVRSQLDRRYTRTELALAGDLARRIAIAVDNAQLYRDAQRALAARDDFLSIAAHELKTPITNVLGFVELANRQFSRAEGPDQRRLERAVETINRESLKLSRLVSQLFDISRIEAGQFVLERAPADVAQLVREVVASVQLTTDQHTIAVTSPPSVTMLVDPLRLEQVVTNLLGNAIKYSPHGGEITVEVATHRPGWLRLAVRDRGVGIPSERRARLFERYYQTRARDRVAGLGLGLYICRQIVEAHDGQIDVEFPPDGGTRFVVDLPIDPEGRREQGDR